MRSEEGVFVSACSSIWGGKGRKTALRKEGCAFLELLDRVVGAAAPCVEAEIAVNVILVADGAALGMGFDWGSEFDTLAGLC